MQCKNISDVSQRQQCLKKYRTLDEESLNLHNLLFGLFLVGLLGLIQLSKMVHLIYPKTKNDHNKYGNNSNTLNEKVHQVPGGKIQILIYCL